MSGEPVPVFYDSCWKGRLSSKVPTRTLQNFERMTTKPGLSSVKMLIHDSGPGKKLDQVVS